MGGRQTAQMRHRQLCPTRPGSLRLHTPDLQLPDPLGHPLSNWMATGHLLDRGSQERDTQDHRGFWGAQLDQFQEKNFNDYLLIKCYKPKSSLRAESLGKECSY